MRISTSWLYTSGAGVLTQKQADLARTQQQISSGNRVLTPADDPVAAADALTTQESMAIGTQYAGNQTAAQAALSQTESTLGQVSSTLQSVRTLAVQAGNGTLNAADRQSLAGQLQSQIDTLMGLANASDGAGGYLFSGYQSNVQPFAKTASGIVYQGDQGSRSLQVSAQRTMDIGANGASVFEGTKAGNGTFTVSVPASNTGSGIADAGVVTNPSALTGHTYQVKFHAGAGPTTYDVVDQTTSTTVISGGTYTPGTAISFDGQQFSMTGTPADNDTVTVAPSARQSLFTTLSNLVNTLQSSAAGTLNNAAYQSQLTSSLASIDQASNQVLAAQTSAGGRLNELTTLGTQNASQKIAYQGELASLTGVDYNAAVSTLSQQTTSLQAAQQSYLKVTGLSLFNYL